MPTDPKDDAKTAKERKKRPTRLVDAINALRKPIRDFQESTRPMQELYDICGGVLEEDDTDAERPSTPPEPSKQEWADLDYANKEMKVKGKTVSLTPYEADLFKVLFAKKREWTNAKNLEPLNATKIVYTMRHRPRHLPNSILGELIESHPVKGYRIKPEFLPPD
jgi:DNA-binding response OmpR family regulator